MKKKKNLKKFPHEKKFKEISSWKKKIKETSPWKKNLKKLPHEKKILRNFPMTTPLWKKKN